MDGAEGAVMADHGSDGWRNATLNHFLLSLRLPAHLVGVPSTDAGHHTAFRSDEPGRFEAVDVRLRRSTHTDHEMMLWVPDYEAFVRAEGWQDVVRGAPQTVRTAGLTGDLVPLRYADGAATVCGYLWVARRGFAEILALLYRCGPAQEQASREVVTGIIGSLSDTVDDPLQAYIPVGGEALSRDGAHAPYRIAVRGRIRDSDGRFEPHWVPGEDTGLPSESEGRLGRMYYRFLVAIDEQYDLFVILDSRETRRKVGGKGGGARHITGDTVYPHHMRGRPIEEWRDEAITVYGRLPVHTGISGNEVERDEFITSRGEHIMATRVDADYVEIQGILRE